MILWVATFLCTSMENCKFKKNNEFVNEIEVWDRSSVWFHLAVAGSTLARANHAQKRSRNQKKSSSTKRWNFNFSVHFNKNKIKDNHELTHLIRNKYPRKDADRNKSQKQESIENTKHSNVCQHSDTQKSKCYSFSQTAVNGVAVAGGERLLPTEGVSSGSQCRRALSREAFRTCWRHLPRIPGMLPSEAVGRASELLNAERSEPLFFVFCLRLRLLFFFWLGLAF